MYTVIISGNLQNAQCPSRISNMGMGLCASGLIFRLCKLLKFELGAEARGGTVLRVVQQPGTEARGGTVFRVVQQPGTEDSVLVATRFAHCRWESGMCG